MPHNAYQGPKNEVREIRIVRNQVCGIRKHTRGFDTRSPENSVTGPIVAATPFAQPVAKVQTG